MNRHVTVDYICKPVALLHRTAGWFSSIDKNIVKGQDLAVSAIRPRMVNPTNTCPLIKPA